MSAPQPCVETSTESFAESRACFEELVGWLEGSQAAGLTHGELEEQLDHRGRELLRRMYQGQLELRSLREQRVEVTDAEGSRHGAVESGHARPLSTVFGPMEVTRMAYRRRGHTNLCPADGALNLPVEQHSHGLRRMAAVESSRGSFEQAADALDRYTGQSVGKRQVEALTTRAAVDVDDFYATTRRPPPAGDCGEVLVISADGKGIVMRPDSLRAATAKAAGGATAKLSSRLSKGEKRHRKRLAEVGVVYDLTPTPRTAEEVMTPSDANDTDDGDTPPRPGPRVRNKWLSASVVDDAADVLAGVFDEAQRRDPDHDRSWVALVDGNNHQIDRIQAEATARGIEVAVVIDLIHVLEYLWAAAWCFHAEADPAAEDWVRDRALAILAGRATTVAAGLRRRASTQRLSPPQRKSVDAAARYLVNKAPYLDYPTALAAGWPIATGVIEGACRHLIADRM